MTLLLSLVLLAFGETLWTLHHHLWDGGLLLALGMAGLFLHFRRPRPARIRPRRWTPRGGLRFAALLLALAAALTAQRQAPEADFTGPLLLWLAGLMLFAGTLIGAGEGEADPALALSRREWAAFALLLGAAAFLRFWHLGTIPANFGGDEGIVVDYGRSMLQKPLGNPFATFWLALPTMSALIYTVAARLFGWTVFGVRSLSALAGTLAVGATFFLGRRLGGRRLGWLAGAVMATWAYPVHFSRVPMNNIFDALLAPLAFWALWTALAQREGGHPGWGWSGLAAGLGWYVYWGARWITVMVALFLFWRTVVEPHFLRRYRAGLRLWAAGWLVAALPMLGWYVAHPETLSSRSRQVIIFTNGWVEQTRALTGKPVVTLLVGQFWRALTAFHLTPDTTFWYRPGRPLLDPLGGLLLLVGIACVLSRWRWPARGLTALWFFSTLVVAWGITVDPPSSQRGILLIPAVALLVGWGAMALGEAVRRYGPRLRDGLLVLLMTVFAVSNVAFYFVRYTPTRVYGNPTAYQATEICRYLQQHPMPGSTVYFFGAPYLYWNGLGTFRYLAPDQAGVDIEPDEVPEGVTPPARFIFVPQRAEEVERVKALYPGGRTVDLRTEQGERLAVIYEWEP